MDGPKEMKNSGSTDLTVELTQDTHLIYMEYRHQAHNSKIFSMDECLMLDSSTLSNTMKKSWHFASALTTPSTPYKRNKLHKEGC
jgi:hypothetical protein